MKFKAKGIISFIFLFSLLIGEVVSADAVNSISINYLGNDSFVGVMNHHCLSDADTCNISFTPHIVPTATGNLDLDHTHFNAMFYKKPEVSGEYGSITMEQGNNSVTAPIHINFDELKLGHRDSPQVRAAISFFHPSLITQAKKEMNNEVELNDYLVGDNKLSQTMHLFKPESHTLSPEDDNLLKSVLSNEFLAIDIGDSYSMIMVFDDHNLPVSIYVIDRWRLFRHSLVKTIVGYGDLAGLILHSIEVVHYSSSLLGLSAGSHPHSHGVNSESIGIARKVIGNVIGLGFHIVEIADHTQGVGEFLYGGQKHYHDHHHGIGEQIFGVLHLGHTIYETYAMRNLEHGIQLALTLASFGYHHIPEKLYEYSLVEALKVTASKKS